MSWSSEKREDAQFSRDVGLSRRKGLVNGDARQLDVDLWYTPAGDARPTARP